MGEISVLGMGLGPTDLTAAHLEIIRSADLLMGGRRHLAAFRELAVPQKVIAGKLAETIAFLKSRDRHQHVVVLASGDPLLYGIGNTLVRELGAQNIRIIPNVSAVTAAFARIREPWANAPIISLHGRDQRWALRTALKTGVPLAVLTDPRHSPAWLAAWMLKNGMHPFRMAVFEQLGGDRETQAWYDLSTAAQTEFAQPNLVILKPDGRRRPPALWLGMPEEAFVHQQGLITKAEVRAVSLSKLCLAPGQVLWDLGAGSGAVGIEASLLLGDGRIFAVEQRADRLTQIQDNIRRFGVYNMQAVQRRLPDELSDLPDPERVFIGGGGARLPEIIATAVKRLHPGGVVVINATLIESLASALKALETHDLTASVTQVQINHSRPMPQGRRMAAQNPIWVVTGKEKEP